MRSDVFTVLGTKYVFVANLPVSLSAKEFRESVTFGEVMGKSLMSCFFTHGVVTFKIPQMPLVQC